MVLCANVLTKIEGELVEGDDLSHANNKEVKTGTYCNKTIIFYNCMCSHRHKIVKCKFLAQN